MTDSWFSHQCFSWHTVTHPPLPLLMSFVILLFILRFSCHIFIFFLRPATHPCSVCDHYRLPFLRWHPPFFTPGFNLHAYPSGPADWAWLRRSLSAVHPSCPPCSPSWVVPSLPQPSFCAGTTELPLSSLLLPLTVAVQVQAYIVPFPARL